MNKRKLGESYEEAASLYLQKKEYVSRKETSGAVRGKWI